ncbi:hypothetical protein FACS189425_04030 [Clostridia bacterium]|nr:hypothetical protein FACS189425_04030 [Clostridia bacterium]
MIKKFIAKLGIPEIIALSISIIVLAVVFIIPIAVSDGGTLYKTIESHGYYYLSEPTADYAQFQYAAPNGIYDIRTRGAIFALFFLISVFLIVHFGKNDNNISNITLAILTPLIFADFSYTAYLNTFFPAAPFLIATLLISGLFLWLKRFHRVPAWLTYIFPLALLALIFAFAANDTNLLATINNARPTYLGNFAESAGKPLGIANGFTIYSFLKSHFFPSSAIIAVIFFAVYSFFIVKSNANKVYISLPILALATRFIPVTRNFFAYNVIFDLIILASIVGGIRILQTRNASLRQQFGVTQ